MVNGGPQDRHLFYKRRTGLTRQHDRRPPNRQIHFIYTQGRIQLVCHNSNYYRKEPPLMNQFDGSSSFGSWKSRQPVALVYHFDYLPSSSTSIIGLVVLLYPKMSMLLLIFLNSYYVGTFSNAIENSGYSYACVIPKSPSKSKSSKTTHSER